MTVLMDHSTTTQARSAQARQRLGGVAALVEAGTFVFGIAMFGTVLSEYTAAGADPAGSVAFVADHQGALYLWYLVTLILFGVVLVPLTLALHDRLRAGAPGQAQGSAAFGLIWAGLVLATGMIANVGLPAVSALAGSDRAQAQAVWSALDAVQNGLGGGNEIAGGIWVLLVSWGALKARALSPGPGHVGIAAGVAGLVTVIPGLEVAEMVFGLALIVWFAWVGVALLRDR